VTLSLFGEQTGRTDSPAELAEKQVDYTPIPVCVQVLLALEGYVVERPRCLDPAAGSGAWCRAMRAVYPGCYIVAVEPRESERANLEAAADEVFIGTFEEYLATNPEPFDLIAGNPPFAAAFSECFWPGLIFRAGLLKPGGTLSFYGLSQWGQSADGSARLRVWSPSVQYRVGGRVEHRGKGAQTWAKIPKDKLVPGGPTHELRDNGGDSREYCHWVWHEDDRPNTLNMRRPSWTTDQLLEMPIDFRRWDPESVPGTYPVEPALVELIRERYL
jgi:hypothetical protein